MAYDTQQAPDQSLDAALRAPQVSLCGPVNGVLLAQLRDQFAALQPGEEPVVVDFTTEGGEADTGRRMALEIRLQRERLGRRIVFLGKTMVYSAGTTVMAAFPVQDRWLTRDCRLLIHERHMDLKIDLCLGLTALRQELVEKLSQVDVGLALEDEGFRALAEGSRIDFETLKSRALGNYYVGAEEALELGLIAGLI
jgi:hypothetical protein